MTEKIKHDFYFEEVLSAGLKVEYWDLSNIYFPKLYNIDNQYLDNKFFFFNEVETQLENEDNDTTLYVLNITYGYRVIKLFRLLTKFNCKITYFARGALPNISFSKNHFFLKILKTLCTPNKLYIRMQNLRASYLKKIGFIKKYDFVFTAGSKGIETIGQGFNIEQYNSELIKINYFDFDIFRKVENAQNIIKEKYCVFLDEYLPYHPDFKMFGINTIEPESYYIALNRFFKNIEDHFKISVVIAAHPKANIYKNENPFGNRQLFFNKTAILCKYAEFAMLHVSSSLSYPILFEKPCYFISTDRLKNEMPTYHQLINCYADEIGQPFINIDEYHNNVLNVLHFHKEKYANYKYRYLTSKDSENNDTAEIFTNFITRL